MAAQLVTPRMVSLVYDGTNSAAIIAMLNTECMITEAQFEFTIISEGDGALLAREPYSIYGTVSVSVGDVVVVGAAMGAQGLPAANFTSRYTVVGAA